MVDVAEPSLAFVALCAFVTESDLHTLRRLGRSCARCADLYWARDGKSRHRALQLESSRVRSLYDDDKTATLDDAERAPLGLLAFIDIIDDAVENGNLPFGDLFLFARRTMQDDARVLLYLLVFAIVTDRTMLVQRVLAMGEDWHEGVPPTEVTSIVPDQPAGKIRDSGEARVPDEADDEAQAAMRLAVAIYQQEQREAGELSMTESYDTDSDDEDAEDDTSDDEDDETSDEDEDAVESSTLKLRVASHPRAAALNDSGASRATVEVSSAEGGRRAGDFFSQWWPALGVHNTPVLRKYFFYYYPARTDLMFEDREAVEQLTLAERLMALAAVWSSQNVSQLLLSTPVFRCNTSIGVVFACTAKLEATLLKSAGELASIKEIDRNVLAPVGIKRLQAALNNPCKSLAGHIRRLGVDATYCDALARYADPRQRPLLDDDELALLKGSVKTANNDDDDDGDTEKEAEPKNSFDLTVRFQNDVDHTHVFWYACETNNPILAQTMVEKFKVVPSTNESYAVRLSARCNSAEVLRWLLTRDDIEAAACDNAALCLAVDVGAFESVKLLLATDREKTKINPAVGDNYSICRAAERGDARMLAELVADADVDVNARECTPLLHALRRGSVPSLRELARSKKFDVARSAVGELNKILLELGERAKDGSAAAGSCYVAARALLEAVATQQTTPLAALLVVLSKL